MNIFGIAVSVVTISSIGVVGFAVKDYPLAIVGLLVICAMIVWLFMIARYYARDYESRQETMQNLYEHIEQLEAQMSSQEPPEKSQDSNHLKLVVHNS